MDKEKQKIADALKIEVYDLNEEAQKKKLELDEIQRKINEKVITIKQLNDNGSRTSGN